MTWFNLNKLFTIVENCLSKINKFCIYKKALNFQASVYIKILYKKFLFVVFISNISFSQIGNTLEILV